MKIAIATDAWRPQINGVVRAIEATAAALRAAGHEVLLLTPAGHRTLPCPTYPEIRLAIGCGRAIGRSLDEFAPDAVHVATEGPIGLATRGWCRRRQRPFTSSFHTRFPDYLAVRTGFPANLFWPMVRWFHRPATRTLAVTAALVEELEARGLGPAWRWPLGVNIDLFSPDRDPHPALRDLPRPILLNVGRVAVEKNLPAFLDADVSGTKVVVGAGPALAALRSACPQVVFLGALEGVALASAYAGADVFVFPSRTDTFGLVNIEALASGLPVAAYPVRGSVDIVGADGRGVHGGTGRIGALDEDLAVAITIAQSADRAACRAEAERYSWARCTDAFVAGLAPFTAKSLVAKRTHERISDGHAAGDGAAGAAPAAVRGDRAALVAHPL